MTDLYLFTVEDAFYIKGRGSIAVPGVPEEIWGKRPIKIKDIVKLLRPDGKYITSEIMGFSFSRDSKMRCLLDLRVPIDDIPVGTKIFLVCGF